MFVYYAQDFYIKMPLTKKQNKAISQKKKKEKELEELKIKLVNAEEIVTAADVAHGIAKNEFKLEKDKMKKRKKAKISTAAQNRLDKAKKDRDKLEEQQKKLDSEIAALRKIQLGEGYQFKF